MKVVQLAGSSLIQFAMRFLFTCSSKHVRPLNKADGLHPSIMVVGARCFNRFRVPETLQLLHPGLRKAGRLFSLRCYSSPPLASPSLSFSYPALDPSCFTSSVASLVDISEFLINGCKWNEAPSCPDYVGPVSIARTPDGRGRGIFATRDVAAGDVIIISNAFAATYNDTDRLEMFFKISSILKESPRILRQYYCLAGDEDQNNDAVPDVRMFDPRAPYDEIYMHGDIVFDEKRIIHIMNVNSFSGDVKVSRKDPEMRLTGLWLLPSFLNHSCIPNASRLIVGETMFIIASRSIKPQEEITISYTDAMSPLKKREKNLSETGYGFLCRCRRCMLERSVHHEIEKFSDRYDMLYDKAAGEVYAAVTNTNTPTLGSFPSCSELTALYHTLNQKVRFLKGLSRLEQQWIMGGYSCAFLGNWLLSGYATQFAPVSNFVNSTALELIKAMKATESGLQRTLSFATLLTMVAEKERGKFSSLTEGLLNFALDECIRIYGKQRLDVSVSLIEQSAEIVPFF